MCFSVVVGIIDFGRIYIYVLGCWSAITLVAVVYTGGRIYTSLVARVQLRWSL